MAAPHGPAEALHTAVGRLRRATGLPVAFGGLVPDGRHGVTLTEFSGTLTGALRGLVVSAGNGLGGRDHHGPHRRRRTLVDQRPRAGRHDAQGHHAGDRRRRDPGTAGGRVRPAVPPRRQPCRRGLLP
ncbi:hypothetical protein [Nonomuraea polychroma]|uniref:hypothetical protein n=1 Tax=Nonomuraea polychroma TaxID=46176 RepID=UPI0019D42A0B|nr:hypothetical protein [Nonomuraea polychroma]